MSYPKDLSTIGRSSTQQQQQKKNYANKKEKVYQNKSLVIYNVNKSHIYVAISVSMRRLLSIANKELE